MSKRLRAALFSVLTLMVFASASFGPVPPAFAASTGDDGAPVEILSQIELLARMSAGTPPKVKEVKTASDTAMYWITFAWSMVAVRWIVIAVLGLLILRRMKRIRKDSEGPKAE